MTKSPTQIVELIPIERISVINPRVRNKKIFNEIVSNIAEIGLKRPITVARRHDADGPKYDLVCGQGRLEAYQSLRQHEIPAIIVEAENEDCLVMSLVENLARRQHRAIDLLHDIGALKQRGYRDSEIAAKTGLTVEYARGVVRLLKSGEHRLLSAVEAGHVPVSVAVEIASADDAEVQQVLQQAYEKKVLRGQRLVAVKRLVEQRRLRGKGRKVADTLRGRPLSVDRLLRTYRDDIDRKRKLVRKAEATRDRLIFVTEGLRKLLGDLDLGLVADGPGEFSDQPVNLRVIFLALVRRQSQHVAIIISQFGIAEAHCPLHHYPSCHGPQRVPWTQSPGKPRRCPVASRRATIGGAAGLQRSRCGILYRANRGRL